MAQFSGIGIVSPIFVHYPDNGISVYHDHRISVYHCPRNSAYHFQQINPAPALLPQRFPNLMSDLIGGNNKVFLLEPMLSAKAEEILDCPSHIRWT